MAGARPERGLCQARFPQGLSQFRSFRASKPAKDFAASAIPSLRSARLNAPIEEPEAPGTRRLITALGIVGLVRMHRARVTSVATTVSEIIRLSCVVDRMLDVT